MKCYEYIMNMHESLLHEATWMGLANIILDKAKHKRYYYYNSINMKLKTGTMNLCCYKSE